MSLQKLLIKINSLLVEKSGQYRGLLPGVDEHASVFLVLGSFDLQEFAIVFFSLDQLNLVRTRAGFFDLYAKGWCPQLPTGTLLANFPGRYVPMGIGK